LLTWCWWWITIHQCFQALTLKITLTLLKKNISSLFKYQKCTFDFFHHYLVLHKFFMNKFFLCLEFVSAHENKFNSLYLFQALSHPMPCNDHTCGLIHASFHSLASILTSSKFQISFYIECFCFVLHKTNILESYFS
jgi:hypothetical protein